MSRITADRDTQCGSRSQGSSLPCPILLPVCSESFQFDFPWRAPAEQRNITIVHNALVHVRIDGICHLARVHDSINFWGSPLRRIHTKRRSQKPCRDTSRRTQCPSHSPSCASGSHLQPCDVTNWGHGVSIVKRGQGCGCLHDVVAGEVRVFNPFALEVDGSWWTRHNFPVNFHTWGKVFLQGT